jgi:hypothetical protein
MSTAMTTTSEIQLVDVTLEARELLGNVPDSVARDPGRFSFGHDEPTAVTLATPDLDDELRASLSTDEEHRFVALRFTCSFRPDDDPLTESRLAIRLSSQQPGGETDPPIARLLQPERLVQPIERQKGFNITPGITVATVTVGGVGASGQSKYDDQKCYLVADGKRAPAAEWFFRKTDAVPLEGMHDLRLIAQVRRGMPALAEVIMTAKIQRRRVGLVPYRALLPERLRTIPLPP